MSTIVRATRLLAAARPALAARPTLVLRTLATYPDDRKYTKSHEWIKLDGDTAVIGISHHATEAMGDIVHCDLPEVGSAAEAGEPVTSVESVKATADVYSPVSGEVIVVNDMLSDDPSIINSDPHNDGWLVKVKVADPAPVDALMSSAEYIEFEQSDSA